MCPPAEHAHHCGVEDTPSLHWPNERPNMKSNSRRLIDKLGGESRSDQLRDRHPFVMPHIPVGRSSSLIRNSKVFFDSQAVSGATVPLVIMRAPRAARLLDLRRSGSRSAMDDSPFELARPTRITMIRLYGNKRVWELQGKQATKPGSGDQRRGAFDSTCPPE